MDKCRSITKCTRFRCWESIYSWLNWVESWLQINLGHLMTMEPLFPTVNRELFGLLASWGSPAIGWFLADGINPWWRVHWTSSQWLYHSRINFQDFLWSLVAILAQIAALMLGKLINCDVMRDWNRKPWMISDVMKPIHVTSLWHLVYGYFVAATDTILHGG